MTEVTESMIDAAMVAFGDVDLVGYDFEAMIDAAMVAFGDTELVGYDFTRRAVTRAVESALTAFRASSDAVEAAPTDAAEAAWEVLRGGGNVTPDNGRLYCSRREFNAALAALSVQSDKGEG